VTSTARATQPAPRNDRRGARPHAALSRLTSATDQLEFHPRPHGSVASTSSSRAGPAGAGQCGSHEMPSTLGTNWLWRLEPGALSPPLRPGSPRWSSSTTGSQRRRNAKTGTDVSVLGRTLSRSTLFLSAPWTERLSVFSHQNPSPHPCFRRPLEDARFHPARNALPSARSEIPEHERHDL